MNSERRVSWWSGLLLLVVLVTSLVAAGLASQVGEYHVERTEVPDVLRRVADHQGTHVAEIAFDLLSWIATTVLGVFLYVTLGSQQRLWALLGTVGFAAGGVVLAMHDIPNFVLTSIADQFVAASGTEAVALEANGSVVLSTASWGLSVGLSFLGLGVFAYGVLIVRDDRVPGALGWLGVAAGALIAIGVWLPRVDSSLNTVFVAMATPVGFWQLGLGVWLLLRGPGRSHAL